MAMPPQDISPSGQCDTQIAQKIKKKNKKISNKKMQQLKTPKGKLNEAFPKRINSLFIFYL